MQSGPGRGTLVYDDGTNTEKEVEVADNTSLGKVKDIRESSYLWSSKESFVRVFPIFFIFRSQAKSRFFAELVLDRLIPYPVVRHFGNGAE